MDAAQRSFQAQRTPRRNRANVGAVEAEGWALGERGTPLAPAGTWCETATVKAELVAFGEIQIEGERYARDVVIDRGRVSRRRKGPSKALRDQFGHTPLSAAEAIPWGGHRLIVGTGVDGRLPIAADVHVEAERRGVVIVALPTAGACRLLADM